MKAKAQERMIPPKPAHDMSASSESESEGDSKSSASSDESVTTSSSSGDDNENNQSQDHAGGDASKNGDSKESVNDDSDSSSSDDSDSDSSDNDATSDESDSSESSSDESEAKVQKDGPESQVDSKIPSVSKAEKSKLPFSSPNKTETPQRRIKQEEEEIDDMPGSSESTPSKTHSSTAIIEGIVKDPAEFTVVDAPGPYTVEDISSKNDYYIFRFPVGMLNPVQLADAKVSIRNQESSAIQVNNRPFEVMAYDYEPGAETPTLFLPDKSGQLNQVDLQIKSQVVIRQPTPQLNTANVVQFNIDDLRSRLHLPPEIKERNFFASIGSRKSTIKKEKLSKEEKKLLKEKGKHSKKAKKKKEEKLSEEATRLKKKEKKLAKELSKKRSLDSEDIISPSSSPKKKKLKKEK